MTRKRTRCLVFIFAILALNTCLSACSPENGNTVKDTSSDPSVKILAAVFPEYDWVREILGEQAEYVDLELLIDNGSDVHSYQPAVKDIMDIASCDLFIYTGGESDRWVEETLEQTERPGREVVSLLDVMGGQAKTEEVVEGMETHGAEDEDGAFDEHVWLSLKNASFFCEVLAEKLADLDPGQGDIYRENAKKYAEKLSRLDRQYQKAVDKAKQKVLLFGDRFPFRYLADDYGLSYYAAFAGCSAESEVSFRTVAFLADKVDEWNLSSILMIKGGDRKIADTIRQNTRSGNQKILEMDSMQSTTSEDIENGAAYLAVMEQNLEVLKTALKVE